jgi:capsular polysaccharide export protein
MSQHIDKLLLSNKVLLLQGPMGDFFYRFAQWLNQKKITCYKINFNGGDHFFYKSNKNVFDYQECLGNFTSWLECFLIEHDIDSIVCFGDCRKYHKLAKAVAQKNNINFFAFEEGYIRPNYITFEQGGVNFFSNFLNHLDQSKNLDQNKTTIPEIYDVKNSYSKAVKSAIIYYFFSILFWFKYPYYEHHRGISPLKELGCGILSGYRRLKNKVWEKKQFNVFVQQYSKKYFTFALQVHNDSQIKTHSELKSVEKYIALVIENFSAYADTSTHLLIKHHPMDRGYRDYRKLIGRHAKHFNVEGRVHYFCDIHLPTVLKHSLGLVTVNSTTGIQALFHHIPVKVLGYALYNLPKLTNQYALSKFWTNPGQVDAQYFAYFRKELIAYSQLNGSFYGISPWAKAYSGSNFKGNIRKVDDKSKTI